MPATNLNTIREFNALANSLQYGNMVENEDIIRRLRTFYGELLRVMPQNHVCFNTVSRLSDALRTNDYYEVYRGVNQDRIQHILNFANKFNIILPPARPVTAIAVQRLHSLFYNGHPEASQMVRDYQMRAEELNEENAIRLLGVLANNNRREITNREAEDIANILFYSLHVESIPYLKDEIMAETRPVEKDYIDENEMIRVGAQVTPIERYSGDTVYKALIRVFNNLSQGEKPSMNDFTAIEGALGLQRNGDVISPALPLSIIAANAPGGKWVYKRAIRFPNMPSFATAIGVLNNANIIEDDGQKVRVKLVFETSTLNVTSPRSQEPESWEGLRCPECMEGTMKKQHGPYGYFWACSRYPDCKCTRGIDSIPD